MNAPTGGYECCVLEGNFNVNVTEILRPQKNKQTNQQNNLQQ